MMSHFLAMLAMWPGPSLSPGKSPPPPSPAGHHEGPTCIQKWYVDLRIRLPYSEISNL